MFSSKDIKRSNYFLDVLTIKSSRLWIIEASKIKLINTAFSVWIHSKSRCAGWRTENSIEEEIQWNAIEFSLTMTEYFYRKDCKFSEWMVLTTERDTNRPAPTLQRFWRDLGQRLGTEVVGSPHRMRVHVIVCSCYVCFFTYRKVVNRDVSDILNSRRTTGFSLTEALWERCKRIQC